MESKVWRRKWVEKMGVWVSAGRESDVESWEVSLWRRRKWSGTCWTENKFIWCEDNFRAKEGTAVNSDMIPKTLENTEAKKAVTGSNWVSNSVNDPPQSTSVKMSVTQATYAQNYVY